ncbi:hypothetical protein [Alloactinosynnema sp. L-07]|uniref:hypothetical protein n=1 Tax=Alloactinosynnema sp. L-07 TaxID=1653480 RepID=UPI00065EFA02|nr:hypothetical protein [Alloactinosynnema sp. L-07]CRK56913.1 hypothetical protein [Alloactinosynnema sp. L-07]
MLDETDLDDLRTGSWTAPAPAEIPALHASLRRWLGHPYFLKVTCDALAAGNGTIFPSAVDPLEAAAILLSEEIDRLAAADLYAVDPTMTAEALTAGAHLPDLSVESSELPSPQGFMVFSAPIGYSDAPGESVPIVACSWGRSPHCAPPGGAVWLTFWSAPDIEQLIRVGVWAGLTIDEVRRQVDQSGPALVWDDEALLCWSLARLRSL